MIIHLLRSQNIVQSPTAPWLIFMACSMGPVLIHAGLLLLADRVIIIAIN